MRLVSPLGDLTAADLTSVGGKAANLGELLAAGLPVPPGFAVTTDAFQRATERAGLPVLLSRDDASPATLREAVLTAGMPSEVGAAIVDAYRGLGSGRVAVRSSATAEDLPGAAFAGQQDTFLGVEGEDAVRDAVVRCWASLFTDRAVAYRRERRISAADVRMAVVVQSMVEADVAGVMFTADPVTGDRGTTVIDAVAGLGEALVSGEVDPEHHILDVSGRPVDGPTGEALLGEANLANLALHGRLIADLFGRPQDIEWALEGDRPWILQARPMTALPPPSVALNPIQRVQAATLTEYLPIRPYPMDVTTSVARGAARMMSEIGHRYGIEGIFRDVVRDEDGVAVAIVPSMPRPTPRVLPGAFRALRNARRFRPQRWRDDPRQAAFLAEIDRMEALDLAALPWVELLEVPNRALHAQDFCRDLRIDYLPRAGVSLLRAGVVVTLLGQRRRLADLLGGVQTRTEDANDALRALAREVREEPRLAGICDPADLAAALDGDDDLARLRGRFEAYLREYGRRETVSPLLISQPTLGESRDTVLGLVLSLADEPEPATPTRSEAARAALLRHPLLRLTAAAEAVGRWIDAAREAVAFREDTHFYFTAVLPPLRRSLLEIGARLRAVGVLDDPSEVFHLVWEEVTAIRDPESLGPDEVQGLRDAVARRAARRAELRGVPMIDTRRVFRAAVQGAIASGTPAGAGTVTAVARIVTGSDEFDRLREGEVLVCPYTNPTWTPLFARAAAVVVDTGSMASHAAIVAREYGVPAIMGTGNGTATIRDGQLVTVDGSQGVVTSVGGHA